ncbi:hypothetical protein B0H14DRAFT_3731466 [Mycena olivaceomarginata]|nr:hypothetical protein B0H14DRAFT_3731466 [Mycena olivaceomarginata]
MTHRIFHDQVAEDATQRGEPAAWVAGGNARMWTMIPSAETATVQAYMSTSVWRRGHRMRGCWEIMPAREERKRKEETGSRSEGLAQAEKAREGVESWENGADEMGECSIEGRATKAAQAWSTGAEAKGRYKLRMRDDVHRDRRAKAASAPHPSSFHQPHDHPRPNPSREALYLLLGATSSSSSSLSGGKISASRRLHRGDSTHQRRSTCPGGNKRRKKLQRDRCQYRSVVGADFITRRECAANAYVPGPRRLCRSGSERGRWVVTGRAAYEHREGGSKRRRLGSSGNRGIVWRFSAGTSSTTQCTETEGEVDEDQKRHPLVRLGEMAIAGKANMRSTTLSAPSDLVPCRQRPGRRRDNPDAGEVALLRTEGIVTHEVAAPGDAIQGVGTASRSGKRAVDGVRIWCRRGDAVRTRYASRRRARIAPRRAGFTARRDLREPGEMTEGLRWGFSGKEMTVPRHRGAGEI